MLAPGSNGPTPLQKLAIEIMSYTTPLLAVEISSAELDSLDPTKRKRQALAEAYSAAVSFAVAHDLPLPTPPPILLQRRNGQRHGVVGAAARPIQRVVQIVNLGRLIRPLFVLAFRAALVFWFLRPFKRPYLPFLIAGWIAWELYTIIFDNIFRAAAAQAQAQGVVRAGQPGGHPGAQPGQGAAGVQDGGAAEMARAGGAVVPPLPVQQNAENRTFWSKMARMMIEREHRAIFGTPTPTPDGGTTRVYHPLGLFHRILVFFITLFGTIHPKFYEARRKALEDRERDIRVLYGRIQEPEEAEQPAPRVAGEEPPPPPPAPPAGWTGRYVNRARQGIA